MSSLSLAHASRAERPMPRARVARRARRTLHLAAAALCTMLVAPNARAATSSNPSCDAPGSAAARRLREIVGVIDRGDVDEMRRYTDSSFAAPATAPAADRAREADVIAGELALIAWRSRGITPGDVCAAAGRTPELLGAGALVRNALTGEIDSVGVQVHATAPHHVRYLTVRTGARTPVAVEDTASEALRIATVDQLARRLAAANAFSGVVLIARDGRPLYYQAFGYADRVSQVPMRRDAQFEIGALGETLTAVSVLQQAEAGKLKLDDTLGALLGEAAPAAARGVRVDELLAHTANMTARRAGRADAPRAFARDAEDYRTLGAVLERVSGRRWEDYLRTRVLDVAGMTATATTPNAGRAVATSGLTPVAARDEAPSVVGYAPVATTMGVVMSPERTDIRGPADPATGMRASAIDLLRFVEALRQGQLLRPETVSLMRVPKPELGAPAYGFGIVRWRGDALWGSSGDLLGADADLEVYGESGYVAVILSNVRGANEPIRRRLAAVMPTTAVGEIRISVSSR